MSFGTDFLALKNSISAYATLVKNKFTTMIPASDKGALNGVAPLVNGLVPAQYLPSFVDDVLEFNDVASFPAVGESGKLYVDISSSGGFNTSPFIASGSTVTAFPTGDANLSESLNNVTGQLQYGNTGSTPYKFALLFAMAAGQSIPVRVTVTNMVSTGPNWNYIGAGSLTTFQSASSSGLTNVTNGQQYTFTISDVNPYLIFRGDYPSDILRTLDILIETQVSGSWVPLTSAVPGTGNCYRWTGSAYLQINNHVGNADVATKLSTARTISITGDASWTVNFDGSGNVTAAMTFANIVTAGTGIKITYNAKGQITGSSGLSASDIPNLDWSKLTTGKPTRLSGYGVEVGSAAAPSINFQDDPDSGLYRSSENVVGLAAGGVSAGTFNSAGDLAMNGNVSGVSDERLKTDWQPLPKDIIHQIAALELSGTYLRKDQNRRQIGVGAQSLQRILPEAVADIEGTLAIIYGNTALAICVELAKHIVILEDEIEKIKERI